MPWHFWSACTVSTVTSLLGAKGRLPQGSSDGVTGRRWNLWWTLSLSRWNSPIGEPRNHSELSPLS